MSDNKKYKKVEALLYNYKKSQGEVENLKLKIKEIRQNYDCIRAISYEEKGSPTNAFNSSVENEIIKKEKEINAEVFKLNCKEIQLEKIDNAINTLIAREKTIVYMKYFEKRTSRDIAAKLDLTEVHVCRLKKRIINELTPLILN